MNSKSLLPLCILLAGLHGTHAETVKDREGAVRQDKANLENDPRWIYNDFEKGFAEGRRTGKPVLVVLRCVPCLACAGIDAKVLLEDEELAPLLDQFVCVRVINANALDLAKFQFDFDLSFTTMIFNGDGTIYGRYGSWTHQKNPREETTDGFRRAMEAALELHAGYHGNKPSLDGKQGNPVNFKTPVDMPMLASKYTRNLDWEGNVVKSCVHCHQIGDALRIDLRQRGKTIPGNLIFPFPAPETIGLEMAPDRAAQIHKVQPGSIAAAAGLHSGDVVVQLNGQPPISSADISWALHNAPDAGAIEAVVMRNGTTSAVTISLPDGWRNHSDISRRVGTWTMRAMALGGLQLEDLPDTKREELGLKKDQLALFAKHVGQYGEHAAAKNAGFQPDDILIQVDGMAGRLSESELIGALLAKHKAGESVSVTVLRNGQHKALTLPMQ